MGTAEKDAIKRVGRSIIAVVASEGLKLLTHSPAAIITIPIIQGLGKFLRAKLKWSWIPF